MKTDETGRMSLRVRICDPDHPHYPEVGRLTGKIIRMKFGLHTEMAEVQLDHCVHGTDSCFVSKGQIEAIEADRMRMRKQRNTRGTA